MAPMAYSEILVENSQFEPTPPLLGAPFEGYPVRDNTISRFDTIAACYGKTDGKRRTDRDGRTETDT